MGAGDDDAVLGGSAVQQAIPEFHNRHRPGPRLCSLDYVLRAGAPPGPFQIGSGANVCLRLTDVVDGAKVWQELEQAVRGTG